MMYRRKGRQSEYQTLIKKFLEHGKNPLKRLKLLRHGIEKAPPAEVKDIYRERASTIFYVFYSCFSTVEAAIQDRAKGKGYSEPLLKDMIDVVLPALERVLVMLPELIHRRWQFNCICLVIRKLLHPRNPLKLRQYGIKLLVLWLQALQDNAGDACMELFASVIPHFPPVKTPMGLPMGSPSPSPTPSALSLCERYGTYSSTSLGFGSHGSAMPLLPQTSTSSSGYSLAGASVSRDVVCMNLLQPLGPAPQGMTDEEITLALMTVLLKYLTTQVGRLQWDDPSSHFHGFAYLFFVFKLFYLACLYKNFRTEAGLYSQAPPPDISPPRLRKKQMEGTEPGGLQSVQEESSSSQESHESDSNGSSLHPPRNQQKSDSTSSLHRKHGSRRVSNPYRMSTVIKLEYDLSEPVYSAVKRLILKTVLDWVLPERFQGGLAGTGEIGSPWVTSPIPSPSQSLGQSSFISEGKTLMRDMWFTSQDNVQLLLEVCRHGFRAPPSPESRDLQRLIDLYFTWIKSPEKPLFMHPPLARVIGGPTGSQEHLLSIPPLATPLSNPLVQPWEVLSNYEGYNAADVQAGLQASLRMCIAHTSQVFLVQLENDDQLSCQVQICERVIQMYQEIAQSWILDRPSWEYLLATLLHLTLELFRGDPPENRETTLGGNLAANVLKTLFICFVRASLVTKVSPTLWDSLLAVLSSLTHWREVITQWKSTMEMMTQILAQTVYGLDLNDLPLNRLERDNHPRPGLYRPRSKTTTRSTNELNTSRMSFSRVQFVPSKLASSPPSKLISNSRFADTKVLRGKLRKAETEVHDDDSPPRSPPNRGVSMGAIPHSELPRSFSTNVGGKFRSVSTVEPAEPESFMQELSLPPGRSVSAGGLYQTHLEEALDELPEDVITPSPILSLPPGLIVPRGSSPNYQRLQEDEPTSRGIITNPHVVTSSPVGKRRKVEAEAESVRGATQTQVWGGGREMDSRELERKRREIPPGQGRQPREVLILQNRDYLSPEPDALSERMAVTTKFQVSLPGGLVLANENSRDSIVSASSEAASTPTPLVVTTAVGRSGANESVLNPDVKPKSFPLEGQLTPESSRRSSLITKSSSESNISRLGTATTAEDSSLRSRTLDDHHRRLRRVVSSASAEDEEEALGEESVDDPFSSAIIPNSREGVISPQACSPLRASPQPFPPTLGKEPKEIPNQSREIPGEKVVKVSSPSRTALPKTGKLLPPRRLMEEMDPTSLPPSLSPPPPPSPAHPLPQTQICWTPVVAAIVWQKMLMILGNVNEIEPPAMHHEAMLCLQKIWKHLADIEANSGISLDHQSTPPLPEFMPPLLLVAPWVLKACTLPASYSLGRLVAFQMLCDMTVKHSHTPPSSKQLTHFYRLMHMGLQPSSGVLSVAVRSGCRLFSHGLPGSTILLSDSVHACAHILERKTSEAPRMETLYLLGSMLYLLDFYSSVLLPHLKEGEEEEEVGGGVLGSQLKEKLVDTLFKAGRKEPLRQSRCVSLYLIGMLAFSELRSGRPSRRLPEGIDILLASLQFADKSVSMVAADMMCLLVEVAPHMRQLYPSMPVRVLQAICYAIAIFMTDEGDQQASWVDKVIVTLILCLRDWLMALPIQQMAREGSLSENTLKIVFEVLQAAAGNSKQTVAKRHAIAQLSTIKSPTNATVLDTLDGSTKSPRRAETISGGSMVSRGSASFRRTGEVRLSMNTIRGKEHKIEVAARSVLTHLLNLLGHFPFGCGAAQMGSVVREYHDSPSLQHLDELSIDIFDSPRVQFFSFNNSAVISFVEIPLKDEGFPKGAETANYQTRLIIRDVTGKYTWDATVLYGPKQDPEPTDPVLSLTKLEESLEPLPLESLVVIEPPVEPAAVTSTPDNLAPSEEPLQPPTWRSHINTGKDILDDVLKYVEFTSPECVLYPGQVGLNEPTPADSEVVQGLEGMVRAMMDQQHLQEQDYTQEAFMLPSMCGEKCTSPRDSPFSFAFHHCRLFLSHLGLFSWAKRNHLDLLEKNNQLILELRHLDNFQVQSRQTYKVAVLYVAPGQEDKHSILSNRQGSRAFEEFIAGLGWEVNMETHAGYMGGLKREFCANTTLPYYATSSEEVLFHVSTRMPSRGRDVEQKVRHLGNDEVHIVWSEHWRDYRRTIFKTQFADVLIVIYPLPNKLFRIQIIKKQNIPHFGPLFDGALVDRGSLPALVRTTAVNALRAQRTPLVSYRGRYDERMKCIGNIVEKNKMKSSYEDFAQNVMHPLDSSSHITTSNLLSLAGPAIPRDSTQRPISTASTAPVSIPSFGNSQPPTPTVIPASQSPDTSRWSLSPRAGVSSLLKLSGVAIEHLSSSPPKGRARSSTNDERMLAHKPHGSTLHRNRSVPENLSDLGKSGSHDGSSTSSSSSPRKGVSPASSRSNMLTKLSRTSPITVPKLH